MDKQPKRKRSKDNPYTLKEEDNNFLVIFKDANLIMHEVEVNKEIFDLMNAFELEDISQMHKIDKHIEHLDLCEEEIYIRAKNKEISLEERVEKKLETLEIKMQINKLPVIQKRRLQKYYFEDKTFEQIAQEEGCTKRAVKFSIDIALEKILKKFKN